MSHPQVFRQRSHAVQLYESEKYLSEAVGRFLAPAFKQGNPMVMIAVPEHQRLFREQLYLQGFDPEPAIRSGLLIQADARETLAMFMQAGLPDADRFEATIGGLIRNCVSRSENNLPVLAYGEMVDVLWREEKYEGAIALEECWNRLGRTYDFHLLCAYPIDRFYKEADRVGFEIRKTDHVQSFLTAIVDSADDAIIGKTLEGMVTSWNRGAKRLFGYTASEILGRPITLLIPPGSHGQENRILERIRRGERIEHYETRAVRKDGSMVDISVTVSPVKNKQGKIIGASKIARDITERKRLEAEAQLAGRVKDEFLATLSHELRTPLNAILGWTNILSSQRSEELVDRAVQVIQRNAEMQKRLIEDLLDMSRILAGKLAIKSDRVDLSAVLGAAVESVRPAATAKGITLRLSQDNPTGFVCGDSDRLQQVVWNLLSNAIKFTPSNGNVELGVQDVGGHLEVSVRDTGEGIRPDFLPYVFERFRQADASTTRQHEGIGVGLAVVRHLVEAHGGTVHANSKGEGQGATFVVKLPLLKECA